MESRRLRKEVGSSYDSCHLTQCPSSAMPENVAGPSPNDAGPLSVQGPHLEGGPDPFQLRFHLLEKQLVMGPRLGSASRGERRAQTGQLAGPQVRRSTRSDCGPIGRRRRRRRRPVLRVELGNVAFGVGEELGGQPTDEVFPGRLAEALQLVENLEVQGRSDGTSRIDGTVGVVRIRGNGRR